MRPLALKIEVDEKYKSRFFDKILKVPVDDCWYWLGQINNSGYAYFKMRCKYYQASRVSYAIHYGHMPQDKLALHTCDNPVCVNPSHLFLGDDNINVQDMVSKGRNVSLNALKTHCKNGHPLFGENLHIEGENKRRCIICRKKWNKLRAETAKHKRHLERNMVKIN